MCIRDRHPLASADDDNFAFANPLNPNPEQLHAHLSQYSATMDRPADSQRPAPIDKQESSPVKVVPPSYRSLYLICYNAISALLWAVVLGRVVLIAGIHGPKYVFAGVGEWTKWTQTLAALEIVHAGIGIPSPVHVDI